MAPATNTAAALDALEAAPADETPRAVPASSLGALHGALAAAGYVAPAPAAPEAAPARRRRDRAAGLAVVSEPALDYAETAVLAAEGFDAAPGTFTPDGLRWLYERAFSDGTTVLALREGTRKVGQIALVHQTVRVAGRNEPAVALIDLFILKASRSRGAMASLYGAVEAFCIERGIRFIVAVPNAKAAPVNVRHLGLAEAARLDIRVGLGGLPVPGHPVRTHRAAVLGRAEILDLVAPFCGGASDGLVWTPERLLARLDKPGADYGLHAGRDLLLVSAPRSGRRRAHTLLCALLPRPGTTPGRLDVAAVVSAACRLHRRPLFVYAGLNHALPLPGLLLPARWRPSPMVLQLRDFRPDAPAAALARFEPLDFDFA